MAAVPREMYTQATQTDPMDDVGEASVGTPASPTAQLVASPRGSGISPRARRTSLESSAAAEDPVETFEDALGEEKMSAQELAELQEAAMQDQALHRFVASKVPLGSAS